MTDVVGTAASIFQLLHTSIKLLGLACDFYETHSRIEKAERNLKEDLKTLLQLCKDVDSFAQRYFRSRGIRLADAHKKSQLLQMALEGLNADVKVFNQKVDQLQASRTRFGRTLRMMWNRAEWLELNARVTSHRVNIGLAFNMLSIDLGQGQQFETRIAYKEASAKMTTLRKHQRSRQSQSQSQSRTEGQSHSRSHSHSMQRSMTPRRRAATLLDVDYDAFCNLAEQVFQDVSDAVSRDASTNRVNSLTTTPPGPRNPILSHAAGTGSDQRPESQDSARSDRPAETHQTLATTRNLAEGMLDRSALSEAAQADRRRARKWLEAAQRDSEHDDRVSRKGETELEKARGYQENAIRRMSELQTIHRIGLPMNEIVDVWTVLAQINELDNKKSDAIDNLINLLALELDEASSIRNKLKIARLSHETENYDVAFSLAHRSYDAAKFVWQQTSTGISEVTLSLDMLIDLYKTDVSLSDFYEKQRRIFEAWSYISRQHPEFSLYLHEFNESPLTYVASQGYDLDVAELLQQNSELIAYRSASGATPLVAAAHEKHIAVVKALLEDQSTVEETEPGGQRIDINERDCHGDSALHAAQMPPSITFYERYHDQDWRHVAARITELLLQHGADPSRINVLGQSALHLAAEQDNCAVMEILLANSQCLLNSRDCSGSTLLHAAIERGRFDMVKLLIEDKAADTTIKDDKGRNALKLAKDPILGTLRNDKIITALRRERKRRSKREGTESISTVSNRRVRTGFWPRGRHNRVV